MQRFTYEGSPVRVVFGPGTARTALAAEIERLDARRVLVIASTRDEQRNAALIGPLGDRAVATFTAVREHVPVATAEAARAAAKESEENVDRARSECADPGIWRVGRHRQAGECPAERLQH